MDTFEAIGETVAAHQVDEFYAWHDFRSAMRDVRRESADFLDGVDDFAADLSEGLDLLDGLADIDRAADEIELSRFELRSHVWQ